jgi:broad specificity phosphatase PhoE
LGAFLLQAGVRRLVASPLERCLDTAQIAAAVAGATVEVNPDLGEWLPGEAVDSIRARFWPVFDMACSHASATSPLALVTHGGPIAFLLEELGMSRETLLSHRIYDHRNPLPPAGAWQVTRPAPGAPWELRLAFVPEPYPAWA